MDKLLSFHNDPKIKAKYLKRLMAHAKADRIIQGQYWMNGKGCAVGCTIEGSDHSRYETELGIPIIIARLEDIIFEGLPNEEAMEFPVRFLSSISVGKDLNLVWPKFFLWLMSKDEGGVQNFTKNIKCLNAIEDVRQLYQRKVNGENIDINEWIEKKNAAYDAAVDDDYDYDYDADAAAAYAAADAAAAYTAAADAADAYAAYAAYADAAVDAAADAYAAYAAYAADAKEKQYLLMAKKLIELLRNA